MDIWLILRIIFFTFLIALGCFALIVFIILRIIRRYYKFPAPALLTRLIDNPIRRKLIQKPEKIALRMNLEPGMIILEIGPGKGSYTKAVAKKILPDGKVYALDIQETVINRLKKKIAKEGITNIIPKIDDAYNLSFEDESVDRVLMIACLPEIPDPIRVLKELNRVLTDHASRYLFAPTKTAVENLVREHVYGKIFFLGDVMAEMLRAYLGKFEKSEMLDKLQITPHKYILVTIHRVKNSDNYGSEYLADFYTRYNALLTHILAVIQG